MFKFAATSIMLIFIAIGNIGGCGGSDSDSCDFEFETKKRSLFRKWWCTTGGFTMTISKNRTGFRDDIGSFTWTRTGCNSIGFDSQSGSGEFVDLEFGFVPPGLFAGYYVLSGFQISQDLGDYDFRCDPVPEPGS